MERYKIIKQVGSGTFGTVCQAINMHTFENVAIKIMKKDYDSWEECINLREVKSLRKMHHPNIVKLKEVIRENDTLFFVFEYMACNLFQYMMDQGKKLLSEAEVRNWCFQVLQGLAYMHQRGYFHRDLKPENLLITNDVLKIADFGLAREIDSKPPYTQYVSTRWYRAPEVILQSSVYGAPVDMWAMGAIMVELFILRPLFPGSSEADEIEKICSVIGSPTKHSWNAGCYLASALNYKFPLYSGMDLSSIIPSASDDAISLIRSLLSWDPAQRPTALEALQHPFFQSCLYIPRALSYKETVTRIPQPAREIKEYMEQKCIKPYSGMFANLIPPNNLVSLPPRNLVSISDLQLNLERDLQEKVIGKPVRRFIEHPNYEQPGWSNPNGCGAYEKTPPMASSFNVSDASEKLANMFVTCGDMKLEKWHNRPPLPPIARPQHLHAPGRTRKVVG